MAAPFPPLRFSLAMPCDAEALAEIYVAGKERNNQCLYSRQDHQNIARRRATDIRNQLDPKNRPAISGSEILYLQAKIGDVHTGYLKYNLSMGENIRIHEFYTLHFGEYRTGSALLHEICTIEENARMVTLTPLKEAIAYYNRQGFECISNHDMDAMRMQEATIDLWRNWTDIACWPRFKDGKLVNSNAVLAA